MLNAIIQVVATQAVVFFIDYFRSIEEKPKKELRLLTESIRFLYVEMFPEELKPLAKAIHLPLVSASDSSTIKKVFSAMLDSSLQERRTEMITSIFENMDLQMRRAGDSTELIVRCSGNDGDCYVRNGEVYVMSGGEILHVALGSKIITAISIAQGLGIGKQTKITLTHEN